MNDLKCEVLSRWARAYTDNRSRFKALIADLDREQAVRQPRKGSWSVAECLDHLAVTGERYQPLMRAAIDKGRQQGKSGGAPYRRRTMAGRMLLFTLEPGRTLRVKAPPTFAPGRIQGLDIESVGRRFEAVNGAWHELLEAADGLALDRVVLGTPVSALVRVNLAEAFRIHTLHEARHLAQAERALASLSSV